MTKDSMTKTLPSPAQKGGEPQHDSSEYQQRLKAAGLDGDMPEDIDEFRCRLARCVVMLLNEWHGCPEPLCRRQRGCMAPNGTCSNLPECSPEEVERDWPEAAVEIRRALDVLVARHGDEW